MISNICIKNFAIIENMEVEFHPGLNIITGETGAGKSIIFEAISLALGARADSTYVRTGCDKAIVELAGDIDGEDVVIRREVSAAGKNLCRLNGEMVTLTELSKTCTRLADVHGQYDHQSLLDVDSHIRLLDTYGKDEIAPLAERVSGLYGKYIEIRQSLTNLLKGYEEACRNRDFLSFELDEIEKADLHVGEDAELEDKISILQNAEAIYSALSQAREITSDGEFNLSGALNQLMNTLGPVSGFSGDIEEIHSRITEMYYELDDLSSRMRHTADLLTFSPEELDEAVARLEVIDSLKRKHGGSIDSILAYAEEIAVQLESVENIDDMKEKLSAELEEIERRLCEASRALSLKRKEKAEELETKIQVELSELAFRDAVISIDFKESASYSDRGIDLVEFLISTNRGEPLKPLAKIASGGEMSRIMLAFKKITAEYDEIPTMIFDEIDAGISGVTASVVGTKLKAIAQSRQILCITHLPQIAACGASNYMIVKSTDESSTHTTVVPLSEEEKVHEIARLLGGSNITDTTLASARELIESCV